MKHRNYLVVYGIYIPIFAVLSVVEYGTMGGALWLVGLGMSIGIFMATWRLVIPLDDMRARLSADLNEFVKINTKLMVTLRHLSNETLSRNGPRDSDNQEPAGKPH